MEKLNSVLTNQVRDQHHVSGDTVSGKARNERL